MLNCLTVISFFAVVLVENVIAEDGFTSRCDFNNSLFVRKGNNATFIADKYYSIIFYKGITMPRLLLHARMFGSDGLKFLYVVDDRVNLTHINDTTVRITLRDVTQDDRGMFMYRGRSTHCWELFVLDIWNPQNITKFEELLPGYIDATPPVSSMVRPRVNATSTWLLDGQNFSHTTDFIEQDGRMIIMRMPRHLNAKNVTYRITEDNGDVHNANLTLMVLYGPYSPLQFSPSRTSYIVTSGDVVPYITCSTDCNPPCEITWDRSGIGNILSLGKVDKLSKGLYTCRATRNGTDRVVERSLYVEVNDGPDSPLQFSPSRRSYIVTSGDVVPDITCSTDCYPPCELTWDRSGIGNILSLGKVDKLSKGLYTCRATRNGTDRVVERSLYVEVNDGPDSPLQFSPSRRSYIVTSGDVVPDITCSMDCNPPCEITWDRSGTGNVLSLGKVDKSSKGMYTCIVTDRVVERSLFVEVNDETSFIAAVTILGTMQGVTLIFIFVFTVYWLRTSERNCSCLKAKAVDMMQNRTKTQHTHETDISTIEMEHYEGLDSSRSTEPGSQDVYENLKLDTVAEAI